MKTPTPPGMAAEIAIELARVSDANLRRGIENCRAMIDAGRDRLGLHAESLANLEAERDRRAARTEPTIDLSKPLRSTGSGGGTVYIYACPRCSREVRVPATSFRGLRRTGTGGLVPIHAEPSRGGILCPLCRSDAEARRLAEGWEPGQDS
jgi:hypothetical protein